MRRIRIRLSTLSLLLVGLSLVFSDRVYISISTGGRGVLNPLPLLLFGWAILLLARTQFSILRGLLGKAPFYFLAPYLFLAFCLPLLGVGLGGYPTRTLFDAFGASLLPTSLLLIGYYLARNSALRGVGTLLFGVILLQFALSCGQMIYQVNAFPSLSRLLEPLRMWDAATQLAYDERYLIYGRAIGTFINPNTLGFWSLVGFWGSAILLQGKRRLMGGLMSILTLVASQSRGFLVTFLVSVAAWALYALASRGRLRPAKRSLFPILVSVVFLLTLLTILISHNSLLLTDNIAIEQARQRFVSLLDWSRDPNLQGRFLAWKEAFRFFGSSPLGTLGPPQVALPISPDNQWVYALLQGGVPYVLTICLLILGGLTLSRKGMEGTFVAIMSVCIAVGGLAALPLQCTPVALFWTLWGMYLGKPTSKTPIGLPLTELGRAAE